MGKEKPQPPRGSGPGGVGAWEPTRCGSRGSGAQEPLRPRPALGLKTAYEDTVWAQPGERPRGHRECCRLCPALGARLQSSDPETQQEAPLQGSNQPGAFALQGHVAESGDISGHHIGVGGCCCHLVGGGQETAEHLRGTVW